MTLKEQLLAFAPQNEQEASDREIMVKYMDILPQPFARNPVAHFTASAWIVNADRTKVLMAFHNIFQSWSWLGGHADGEEDLLSVCLREVREESGLCGAKPVSPDIFSLEILDVQPHRKRGKYVSTHVHWNVTYLIEADERELVRAKPDENSGVQWFDVNEALDAVREENMKKVYWKLMEKVKKEAQ